MNEMRVLTKEIETSGYGEIAKNILKFCIAVTPQFYKNKTKEELQAEKTSIELLTANIEPKVLACMCETATRKYAEMRSRNKKSYFDINFILTFYVAAFNKVNCKNQNVQGHVCIGEDYDEENNVVSEYWKNGEQSVTVRYIYPKDEIERLKEMGVSRFHTPKYFESLSTDLSDVDAIEV